MAEVGWTPYEKFIAELAALNVKLPVNVTSEVGVIADADDRAFLTVDVNGEREDAEVEQIALWIVLAINTCGGFKGERSQSDG